MDQKEVNKHILLLSKGRNLKNYRLVADTSGKNTLHFAPILLISKYLSN